MANTGMLVSMKPTSIAYSGTSASVNNNGGVDFSAVTSVSLNGVFTSDYDNYLIVINYVSSDGNPLSYLRIRATGSDSTASNYTYQYLNVNNTPPSAARASGDTWLFDAVSNQLGGAVINMYGPALSQPTAMRTVTGNGYLGARITDSAGTHSLSTSYDGFTVYPGSGNITGNIHVFGYRE